MTAGIDNKVKQGVMEETNSPWVSNLLVVTRQGTVRLACDYRALNTVTIKDCYTLPKTGELFDVPEGTRWFSCSDASQSFHPIPLANERYHSFGKNISSQVRCIRPHQRTQHVVPANR